MSGLTRLGTALCLICAAVGMISVLIPQKRTRRVMSFVVGLFFIAAILHGIGEAVADSELTLPDIDGLTVPQYTDEDYNAAVAQKTADVLTQALSELLVNEGITADDINLTLKISSKGRITVSRVVIYISEAYADRIGDAERIIYRNVSKEPEIYVAGKKAQ